MDADCGFNQIEVEAREAVDATTFELFKELWCSNRLLFGMKNRPATFERNAVVMQLCRGRCYIRRQTLMISSARPWDYAALSSR